MHKNTDEGWDPYRLVYFGYKAAVLNAQNHWWGMRPLETSYSGAKHTVVHAQNDRWGVGTIETCNSGPKVAVLHAKNTDESWDQLRLVILNLSTLFCLHKATCEGGET